MSASAHLADREVHLPSLVAFEAVGRHLNFARAAEELRITPTAISKTIKQLEARLGVRLFNRTTRSVAMTEGGARLWQSLAPALAQIKQSVGDVAQAAGRPSGQLRLNTSYVAYATLIEPHLEAFLRRFPDIALDVRIDNGLSDIVAAGFDAGIRLGHALQRDMIAVPLGPLQQLVVVGSPAYLADRQAPKTPQDLLAHDCIRQWLGPGGRYLEWNFSQRGKTFRMEIAGRLAFNEMRPVVDAARGGAGLAYVFRQFAEPCIRSGELTVLLEQFTRPTESFHVYYPSRAQMPGKLRAFLDFLREANWKLPG